VAFGNQLRSGEEMPALLGKLLRDRGSNVEVLNLALGGYDCVNVMAVVEHKALGHNPDLIIYVFSLNDVGVFSVNRKYIRTARLYHDHFLFSNFSVARLLLRRSLNKMLERDTMRENTLEVFREHYADYIDPIPVDDPVFFKMSELPKGGPGAWYRDRERIGRLRHAMRRIAEAVGGRIPVAVMVVPDLSFTRERYDSWRAHKIVEHEANRVGFEIIDVVPTFMEKSAKAYLLPSGGSMHPNALGHRIMAEAALEFVTAKLSGQAAEITVDQ